MFVQEHRNHYRVSDGPCHDILIAWRKRREAVQAEHMAFRDSVGAVGHYEGHTDNVGNASAITGLIFAGELPAGWKSRRWKSHSGNLAGKVVGWPDQRTKAGKDYLAKIRALPLLPSTYGPCAEIGFPSGLKYKGDGISGSCNLGFWETLSVGWIKDVFYVSLPDEMKERSRLTEQGYTVEGEPWAPLTGMESILKEEADLDYARAKLAKVAA